MTISDEEIKEFDQLINNPHTSPIITQFSILLQAYQEQREEIKKLEMDWTRTCFKQSSDYELKLYQKDEVIEKLKEGLGFYADSPVWDFQIDVKDFGIIDGKARCGGKRAHALLKEIEG